MTQTKIETLRRRADFLRLNRGRRFAAPGLVLQMAQIPDDRPAGGIRLGLTVTKKIGNAVTRNRVRRRLREAAKAVLPVAGKAGHDYVLIARAGALGRSFDDLKADVEKALSAVHKAAPGKKAGSSQ